MKKYIDIYSEYLLENVVPFWLQNSLDSVHGGFFTCLLRDGQVFDTDKFVWLQAREIWTFAMLYNEVSPKNEWLEMAVQGGEFLIKHGRNPLGHWYFSLQRDGKPLTEAYSIFSDCFAAMAFAQLHKATGNVVYAEIATSTFYKILERKDNPKGHFSKAVSGTRDLKGFALPMILCNLVLEIEHLLAPEIVEVVLREGVSEVMDTFYQEDLKLILENVSLDGAFIDCFEGRLVNPGHGLEAMWFVMDIARRWGDRALIDKCVQVSLDILEYGWDVEHGGIFYFRDIKNFPPQQLEWDQKLWWVHLEALVAVFKGYELSEEPRCLEWAERLHFYIWDHFVDKEYGEMFGYLQRNGDPLLYAKGGKWKGFFHVPRALFQLWKTAERIQMKKEYI